MSPHMRVELVCSGVWEQLIGHFFTGLALHTLKSALNKILNGKVLTYCNVCLELRHVKKIRKKFSLFHLETNIYVHKVKGK